MTVLKPLGGDVGAGEGAFEMDFCGGFVGEVAGGLQVLAERSDAEHAAAAGDRVVADKLGSGVENFYAGQGVGVGDAADDFAFFVAAGRSTLFNMPSAKSLAGVKSFSPC